MPRGYLHIERIFADINLHCSSNLKEVIFKSDFQVFLHSIFVGQFSALSLRAAANVKSFRGIRHCRIPDLFVLVCQRTA